ncbi:MAG: hypothetical protein WCH75_15600, partial [Candidatus Binatia bacterium]
VNAFDTVTVQKACQERLDVLIRDEISMTGTPGSEANNPEVRKAIMRRVHSRFKDLAAAAAGGDINERALRSLLPQLFR